MSELERAVVTLNEAKWRGEDHWQIYTVSGVRVVRANASLSIGEAENAIAIARSIELERELDQYRREGIESAFPKLLARINELTTELEQLRAERYKGGMMEDVASSNSSWADQESTVYSVDALLEEIDEMIPPSLKEEARQAGFEEGFKAGAAHGAEAEREAVLEILKIIGFTPLQMPVGMDAPIFTAGAQMALGMVEYRVRARAEEEK